MKVGIDANILRRSEDDVWPELHVEFGKVFSGLGKLKNYQLEFKINQEVTPVIQPIGRIPFNRWRCLIDKVQELDDPDVVERVTEPA